MRKIVLAVTLLTAALFAGCEGESVEPVETKRAVISEDLGTGLRVGMSSGSLPAETVSVGGHRLQGPRTRQLQAKDTEATLWGSEQLLLAVRSNQGEVQEVTLTTPDPDKLDSNFIETKSGLRLGKSLRAEAHRKLGEPDWTLDRGDSYQERWIQIDRDNGIVYQLTLTFSKYTPTDRTLEHAEQSGDSDGSGAKDGTDSSRGSESEEQKKSPPEQGGTSRQSGGGQESRPEQESSGSGEADSTQRESGSTGTGSDSGKENASADRESTQSSSRQKDKPEKSSWILTSYGYARHRSVSIAEMYLKQGKGEGSSKVTIPGEETRQNFRQRLKQRSESDT